MSLRGSVALCPLPPPKANSIGTVWGRKPSFPLPVPPASLQATGKQAGLGPAAEGKRPQVGTSEPRVGGAEFPEAAEAQLPDIPL